MTNSPAAAPRTARTIVVRSAAVVALSLAATQGPAARAEDGANRADATAHAAELVRAFDALFSGPHEGARAIHTKGVLVAGSFEPTEDAPLLSRAPHFDGGPVRVLVRFSNFAGVPDGRDGDAAGSPRGMAVKFLLPNGGETDIVSHSYNGFPAATAEDFLAFLRALAAPDPSLLEEFAATHPAARTFLDAPKPAPASYATETFYGVNAFRFTNEGGVSHFGRYRLEPVVRPAYLDQGDAASRPADYLADELAERLADRAVEFRLVVQLAQPDDDVADGSIPWPPERATVTIGTLRLTALRKAGLDPFFTPLSLVGGIAPSADPMLVARTRAYRRSYRRRTKATQPVADTAAATHPQVR